MVLGFLDGANMNAQVGITNPTLIGADVCHLIYIKLLLFHMVEEGLVLVLWGCRAFKVFCK